MGSSDLVRLQVRALELKLGVKRGGWRFWLFVANCLVSLFLFVWFAVWLHIVLGLVAVVVVAWVIVFVDVTGYWNGMV